MCINCLNLIGVTMTTQAEVELEMVEIQGWVSKYEALKRLEKNADFIMVISDGYIKEKALDSVSMLAEEGVKRQGQRGDVMEDLVAISNLQYYFRMLKNLGAIAADRMDELEGPETVTE